MPLKQTDSQAFGAVSEVMHAIISWMEALHRQGELAHSLDSLLALVNGVRGSMLRLRLDTFGQTTIAEVGIGGAPKLTRASSMSFSQYLLGHGIGNAQPGSIWYLSEFDRELLRDYRTGADLSFIGRQTKEIAAAVLEPGPRSSDILEIHFPDRISKRDMDALSMVVQVLSRTWQSRSPALFPNALPESGCPPQERTRPDLSSLLGSGNPAGLSKAEFRVCTLLSQGLSAKEISGALGISESTVRSHLRSIYAKTKTQGQRELMFQLLSFGKPAARSHAAPAVAASTGAPLRAAAGSLQASEAGPGRWR